MSWKTETRLSDLDSKTELEITCKQCKKHSYERARDLVQMGRLGRLYLDELEKALRCYDKRCNGPVRVCIVHDDLNEGFVGGMA